MSAYVLCFDVGNTNTKVALYDGERREAVWRVATASCARSGYVETWLTVLLARQGLSPERVQHVGVSSVVPPVDAELRSACRNLFGRAPLFVSSGVKLPIALAYENPRALGADRIANAAAARTKYGAPAIVVDCGTATKVEVISAAGVHLGGAIMPGRQISVDALVRRAAALPHVALAPTAVRIPRNLVESLRLGAQLGLVGAVARLVAEARAVLGEEAPVVQAGGLVHLFSHSAAPPALAGAVYDPYLTVDGVRTILALNA